MPHYKSPDNAVHFIESADFEHLLPAGSLQVSDEEAEALRVASLPAAADAPVSCSPWQIRKALNQLELRDDVELAVSESADITLQDGWSFATEFRSDDPFVIGMGAAIGKTAEETRGIIEFASTL
jgi:hypothetical protein